MARGLIIRNLFQNMTRGAPPACRSWPFRPYFRKVTVCCRMLLRLGVRVSYTPLPVLRRPWWLWRCGGVLVV